MVGSAVNVASGVSWAESSIMSVANVLLGREHPGVMREPLSQLERGRPFPSVGPDWQRGAIIACLNVLR